MYLCGKECVDQRKLPKWIVIKTTYALGGPRGLDGWLCCGNK